MYPGMSWDYVDMGLRVYKGSGVDFGHPGILYASWDVLGLFGHGI